MSPAYDITFSYRKDSIWVSAHQMLINGKSDNITKEDLLKVSEKANIKKSDAAKIIEQVISSVSKWEQFAEKSSMSEYNIKRIKDFLNV